MTFLIDLVFHFDEHLAYVVQHFGSFSYLVLFAIIFAETGFVVTPFLPGDSLLFVVGAFSATGVFEPFFVSTVLISAAILGDSINYCIGSYSGGRLAAGKKLRFINEEHLDKTHQFFEKYGGKTIVVARFVPIVRTFAPFVAGFIRMSYGKFFMYNVIGAVAWVVFFIGAGFFFGNVPLVKENLSLVMLLIVILSIVPAALEAFKARARTVRTAKGDT